MRDSFVETLFNLAKQDNKIKIVTGDLGFGVLKPFYNDLQSCFINAGIAEQNMTSFAAGLAMEGLRPVTYSIGNFPTLRCLEQIRNDVCYPNVDLKIVCVGAGYTYGALGVSHHATEDIGIMRTLPNLTILSPCDKNEAISCTNYMMKLRTPCYLRLGRNGSSSYTNKSVEKMDPSINKILDGKDLCLFATGEIIGEALDAAEKLKKNSGINITVCSCPILKPFPIEKFNKIVSDGGYSELIVLEEHSVINGLSSIIDECFSSSKEKPIIHKFGIKDMYCSDVGSQRDRLLRCAFSLDTRRPFSEYL